MGYIITSILLSLLYFNSTSGYLINITHFGNCEEIKEFEVNLVKVDYEYNSDNICDTIHGRYVVYKKNDVNNYELWLSIYQCGTGTTGPCNDNPIKYVEPLTCNRFHEDNTGPWFMISSALRGSRCGSQEGEYALDTAKLKPSALDNYITFNEQMAHYRIHMLFHKKGETEENEKLHVRGCVNIELDLINNN